MMWNPYTLDNAVQKIDQSLTLWKTDKGIIKIDKDTYAIAILQDGKPEGYIFSGNGNLVLDTIVETEQGAIGKPTEKTLSEPFLMLGNTETTQPHLQEATDNNDFKTKAENLFHHFFHKHSHIDCCHTHHHNEGVIFAFPTETQRLDLLVLNDAKIVYKAQNMTFISNGHHDILKSPENMVVSDLGKCVILKSRC
jgi:hypothetical protein